MKFSKILFIIPILLLISMACALPGLSSLTATDTPVPTITRAPTQTPQPTFTPVPAPTDAPTEQSGINPVSQAANEDVSVILHNSYRVDTMDYVVGILQNNTDQTIEWVELSILIYDENNTLIATESVYPYLDALLPGDTSPFSVYSDLWTDAATYEFLVEDYETTVDQPAEGLEIVSHSSYSDENYLNIIGEIRNNSDQAMSFVKIAAALYAVDGSILNTNYSYTMLDYLAPGAISPFKLWFSDNWQDGDTYEIQVQGDYDTLPEQVIQIENYTVEAGDGYCTVRGSVKNSGSTEIPYGTIAVAFYDASDVLVEAEWNFTDGDVIPAGSSTTFEVTTYSCPGYDHIEVYAGN